MAFLSRIEKTREYQRFRRQIDKEIERKPVPERKWRLRMRLIWRKIFREICRDNNCDLKRKRGRLAGKRSKTRMSEGQKQNNRKRNTFNKTEGKIFKLDFFGSVKYHNKNDNIE